MTFLVHEASHFCTFDKGEFDLKKNPSPPKKFGLRNKTNSKCSSYGQTAFLYFSVLKIKCKHPEILFFVFVKKRLCNVDVFSFDSNKMLNMKFDTRNAD